MPQVGVTVLEEAAATGDGFVDWPRGEHRADRLVSGAEPLGDSDDVGRDVLALERPHRPAASHAAHHLVEDEEDAVAIADFAHAPEVAAYRGHAAKGCAGDGLGDEGDHLVAAQAFNLALKLCPQALPIGGVGLAFALIAVRIAGRDVRRADEERRELPAAGAVAPAPGGARRGARVRRPPAAEPPAVPWRLSLAGTAS